MWRESLLFFVAACAAAGQLGAALYTARLLRFTLTQSSPAEDRAARFGERWTDAAMFHTRTACQNLVNERHNPTKILDDLKADNNKAVNAGNVLNFLEEMALSVNTGRCDEAMAKSLFCGVVVNIWHATEVWAKAQRVERGRPALWCELETLFGKWSKP